MRGTNRRLRVVGCLLLLMATCFAQTVTYHLHKEASTTAGQFQLKTAAPDASSVTRVSLPITVRGDYTIAAFDTQTGDPNTAGTITANSTVTFNLWMQSRIASSVVFPEAKVFLNNASGTLLCSRISASSLTTTAQPFTFSCNTGSAITMAASDRFFLWVGVSETADAPAGQQAKLSVEGTLNASYDSTVTVPTTQVVAATPTFSPTAGTYSSTQNVTISDTTPGAVIHYSTDGSTPTATSPTYSAAIAVTQNTTIKAIAIATNYGNSTVATGIYTITAATPMFSPAAGAYQSPQSVTISDTTTGAVIHYTTDGSTPTASSTTYSSGVSVTQNTTIKAIAIANGYGNSAVGTAAYNIAAAIPTFSPVAGTYTSTQSVTISSTTPGATIYYTKDGSTPTTSSLTGQPVSVDTSETLNGMAVAANYQNSAVVSAPYIINRPPAIASLNPSSGPTGSHVVINGTNFGSPGTVTFNGTAGTVTSWGTTQILAVVPTGVSTGPVQVSNSLGLSNTTTFTVTPQATPNISSMSLSSAQEGTAVTITGQNFEMPTTIDYSITFNGVPASVGTINSSVPSAETVQTIVPTGAASGPVVMTIGGVSSNGYNFTVLPRPQITSVTPNSGSYGSPVVIQGANLGSSGTVTFNGVQATVTNWASNQINVTVPNGITGGPVVVHAATVDSNSFPFHLSLRYVLSGNASAPATAIYIMPGQLAKLIGDNFTLSVIDNFGDPAATPTFTVSDSTVLSISTDTSPVFTALTTGHVTVTATSGSLNASTTVDVYDPAAGGIPTGTTLWSNASIFGTGKRTVQGIALNVGDPDLFTIEADSNGKGFIRASDHDGNPKWSEATGLAYQDNAQISADGQGGVLYQSQSTLLDIRGGDALWRQENIGGNNTNYYADRAWDYSVGQNGSVYVVQHPAGANNVQTFITLLDSNGHPISIINLPNSRGSNYINGPPTTGDAVPQIGAPLLAGDGSFYLEVLDGRSVYLQPIGNSFLTWKDSKLQLLRIAPGGAYSLLDIKEFQDAAVSQAGGSPVFQNYPQTIEPEELVPDNEIGVLATWQEKPNQYDGTTGIAHVKHVTDPASGNAGMEYVLPLWSIDEAVLGENGRAFARGYCVGSCYYKSIVAFDYNSGSPVWQYTPPDQNFLKLTGITVDGSLVANEGVSSANRVVRFDSSGTLSTEAWSTVLGNIPDLSYDTSGVWYSLETPQKSYLGQFIDWVKSHWTTPSQDNTRNAAIISVRLQAFQLNGTNQQYDKVAYIKAAQDFWWQKAKIELKWDSNIAMIDPCAIHSGDCLPQDNENLLELSTDPTNGWLQIKDALIRFPNRKGLYIIFNESVPGGDGGTARTPIDPAPAFHGYTNLLFMPQTGPNVIAHEFGHIFGLPHVPSTFNLMCGKDNPTYPWWDNFFLDCTASLATGLKPNQISIARDGASQMQGP